MRQIKTHKTSSPRVALEDRDEQRSVQSAFEYLQNEINEISKSVNHMTRSGDSETHLGKPGDIKINKRGKKQFEMLIRGEDAWYRDANSTYVGMDTPTNFTENHVKTIQSGSDIEYRFKNIPRLRLDLDKSTTSGTATPKIVATGNLTLDVSGDMELNADGGDITMKDNTAALASLNSNGLKVDNIKACGSDVDKFLVSNSGVVEYRTGTQVLSDIGGSATAGTVTEVTVGAGLDVVNGTSTPAIALDLSELTDGTADVVGSADELIYLDASTQKRKQINEIKLGQFNNDQGWTSNAGDITGVDLTGGTNISIASETGTTSGNYSSTINQSHFMSVQTHAFYIAGTSEVYLPFGPSAVEGSSTADAANDDTLFIAPYAGSLEFIKLQSASTGAAAGATRMELRVNGTDGAYVQVTISNETTATFTWSSDNTFSAGDRLRITFDTTAAAKYVSATSVWKYTL